MKNWSRAAIAGLCLSGLVASAFTQTSPKAKVVTTQAKGTFEVKLVPQVSGDKTLDASLGRLSIDKQFQGDLEGTGKGQMLTAITGKGSAGYVAMELVSGTLNGRAGTFVLQHTGIMTRGASQLNIAVVPDSGTGSLVGLAGTMIIKVAEGKHSYEFDYTLAETPPNP